MDVPKTDDWKNKVPENMEKQRLNHVNYDASCQSETESDSNDCKLLLQKTEMNIPQGGSNCAVPAGSLENINFQLSYNGSDTNGGVDLARIANTASLSMKTIFEDADYFAKNYIYKLMPIMYESVDENIIHLEHNYCNSASTHEGNVNHDEEERNYKKRKSKLGEISIDMGISEGGKTDRDRDTEFQGEQVSRMVEGHSLPMDLSLCLQHEQRTDKLLKESQTNILKVRGDTRISPDVKQFDMRESNKENVTSRKIEVTIRRPQQKEYYQPCEVFLNDLARISPDLIKNDCYEIDIIDRTGQHLQEQKCRTYYIISESTWQLFENSTERIILTNDLNLGQPVKDEEKQSKPTYLIFDQISLAESLTKISEGKGGSFRYTCLEESNEVIRREAQDCGKNDFLIGKTTLEDESRILCHDKPSMLSHTQSTGSDEEERICDNHKDDFAKEKSQVESIVKENAIKSGEACNTGKTSKTASETKRRKRKIGEVGDEIGGPKEKKTRKPGVSTESNKVETIARRVTRSKAALIDKKNVSDGRRRNNRKAKLEMEKPKVRSEGGNSQRQKRALRKRPEKQEMLETRPKQKEKTKAVQSKGETAKNVEMGKAPAAETKRETRSSAKERGERETAGRTRSGKRWSLDQQLRCA